MKKFMFFGILLTTVLFATRAFGQPLITETFEDYTVGSKLVQQAKMFGYTHWTTWDGSVGGAIDATITSEQAQQGTNAAKFAIDNDVILLLGDKVSGAYKVTFYMYVPSGQTGYFNVLHKVPGSPGGHEWAMEIYFESGVITIYAGSQSGQTLGSYPQATWLKIELTFDLDEDQAAIALNDNTLHTWKFSIVAGGGDGTKQLGGIDFYGGETGSVFNYYIDNIVYEQISDELPLPIVTVFPDTIVKELKSSETGNTTALINNEGEGTQDALWFTYIKYPDSDLGTYEDSFNLIMCNENSVYSDGNGGLGYGTGANYIVEMAMRLTPEDYKTKLGGEITEVSYFVYAAPHAPVGDLTFRVYGQGYGLNVEGDVLAEKVLSKSQFTYDAWNSVTLDEAVKLTGGEYWVTVEFEAIPTTSFPMAHDDGPAKWGGDWDRLNHGPWSRLIDGGGGYSYNYAIKAKGSGTVRDVFVAVDKATGTTKPGESTTLTFTFNSGTYPEDRYEATLIVHSNDETNPVIEVPILMIVDNHAPNTNAEVKQVMVDDSIATVQASGTDFRVTVPYTEKVNIVVTPEDDKATVTGQTGEQAVIAGTQNKFAFTVTAEDKETIKDYTLTVIVDFKPPAISELNKSVKLFPNPVTDYLYIESEFPIEHITIYDLTGKMVKQIRQATTGIDMSDLATGFYLMKITTEQGEAVHKFVKQ